MELIWFRETSVVICTDHVTDETVRHVTVAHAGPCEELLTTANKKMLPWYSHETKPDDLAKTSHVTRPADLDKTSHVTKTNDIAKTSHVTRGGSLAKASNVTRPDGLAKVTGHRKYHYSYCL